MLSFAAPIAGVFLLVVGCVLTILASARRTPPVHRPANGDRARVRGRVATARPTVRSASVARLQKDVGRWATRG